MQEVQIYVSFSTCIIRRGQHVKTFERNLFLWLTLSFGGLNGGLLVTNWSGVSPDFLPLKLPQDLPLTLRLQNFLLPKFSWKLFFADAILPGFCPLSVNFPGIFPHALFRFLGFSWIFMNLRISNYFQRFSTHSGSLLGQVSICLELNRISMCG
jgi:hypothetical protein